MNVHRVVMDLQSIREDVTATEDERQAAKAVQHLVSYRGTPDRECLAVLKGYVARQLQQDRFGK